MTPAAELAMRQDRERITRELDRALRVKRCEYCDGTGDVHGFDGEWRGYCTCKAGESLRIREPVDTSPSGWGVLDEQTSDQESDE